MVKIDLLLCVSINDVASLYTHIYFVYRSNVKYTSVICVTNKRFTNLNM